MMMREVSFVICSDSCTFRESLVAPFPPTQKILDCEPISFSLFRNIVSSSAFTYVCSERFARMRDAATSFPLQAEQPAQRDSIGSGGIIA